MKFGYFSLIGLALVIVGCGGEPPAPEPEPVGRVVMPGGVPEVVATSSAAKPNTKPIVLGVDAGLPLEPEADPTEFTKLVANRANSFGLPRRDPFALRGAERAYDVQQSTQRLLAATGGFQSYYEDPIPVQEVPFIQPQPYRRLSGIVVGDAVFAILEEPGKPAEIVRPGQRIPGTEWTILSIDLEKAILRRNGNVLPKEIRVRLESPPAGFDSVGGSPFGGSPEAPEGGAGSAGEVGR